MGKLREIGHLLVTVLMAGLAQNIVVPAIVDVTMDAVCPGQQQCSLAIYLSGLNQAITGVGAVVMTPIIGNLSDKYGRKTLLTLPLTLSIVPPAILAYSRTTSFFYAYYVMKIITSMVSQSTLASLALAYTADKVSEGQRISAFGMVTGVLSASFVCGNLAARFIPLALIFQVATLVSVVATVYMRVFLDESISRGGELTRPVLKEELGETVPELPRRTQTAFRVIPYARDAIFFLRRSPTFLLAATVSFFSGIGTGGTEATLLYFLKARFEFNKNQFADLMVTVGVLGTIAQMIVMPLLSPAIGEKWLLSIALLADFAHVFLYSISWAVWVPYAAVAFAILAKCANPCICGIASKQVSPNEQGKAQGCIYGIQSFANILSPLLFNPLTALFLSKEAPFYFPGFGPMCLALSVLVAFALSLMININPSINGD